MNNKLLNLIASNKLFENSDVSLLNTEEVNGELLTFSEGSLIYSEGSPAQNVYLVMEGRVNVVKTASLGNPESNYFSKDDFFGLEEIIENIPRISTAVAVTDVYIIGFTLREARLLIRQSPEIKNNILKYSNINQLEQIDEFLAKREIAEELKGATDQSSAKTPKNKGEETTTNEEEPQIQAEEQVEKTEEETTPGTKEKPLQKKEELKEEAPAEVIEESQEELKPKENKQEEEEEQDGNHKETSKIITSEGTDFDLTSHDLDAELWDDEPGQEPPLTLQSETPPLSPFIEVEEEITETAEDREDGVEPEREEDSQALAPDEHEIKAPEEPEVIQEERLPVEEEQVADIKPQAELPENLLENVSKIFSAGNLAELKNVFSSVIKSNFKTDNFFFFEKDKSGRLFVKLKKENSEIDYFENNESPVVRILNNNKPKQLDGDEAFEFIANSSLKELNIQFSSLIILPLRRDKIKYGVIILADSLRESLPSNWLTQLEFYSEVFLNHAANLRLLEEENREMKLRLTENLNVFLANNIKKRLLVIKNFAKAIKEKETEEEKNKFAEYVADETLQLVQSLKDVELLALEEKSLRKTILKLSKFLSVILSDREDYFKEKYCNVFPEFNFDGFVAIDALLFENALLKIIRNACEAMPFGGNLEVKLKEENGYALITFADNGAGIDETVLPFIYEPFTSFNKQNHAGLGLTVAKKIIELHKGRIEIQPKEEKGTVVSIWLPVSEL